MSSTSTKRKLSQESAAPAQFQPDHSTALAASAEKKARTAKPDTVDYDFVVIGGGSAGLAASKAAKALNPKLRVAVIDFVQPSHQGTKWGLGGTCVNVGCIPKKLMHYAGQYRVATEHARNLGWSVESKHDFSEMLVKVNNYIKNTNMTYRAMLKDEHVDYINKFARFLDAHTLELTDAKGGKQTITFERALISVGGRPRLPTNVPGWQLGITSDDIFWQKRDKVGKTLVIGAGYIALEIGGFLHELGNDVTIAVRSTPLREFDAQAAAFVAESLERSGLRFIRGELRELKRTDGGRIAARVSEGTGDSATVHSEEYDTVLHAMGREAVVTALNLDKAGVQLRRGKIAVDSLEATSAPHIFALGDCADKRAELTPIAIKAGELLAARLFGGATRLLDEHFIPTTVFTPIEYGTVGLSQQAAEEKYGKGNVDAFVSRFSDVESGTTDPEQLPEQRSHLFTGQNLWARKHALEHKAEWIDFEEGSFDWRERERLYFRQRCLAKLVVAKELNGKKNVVVGLHYVGPNAGEITQGFALALKAGITKQDFDDLIGIHPTTAEEFTLLTVSLSSGASFIKSRGCCG